MKCHFGVSEGCLNYRLSLSPPNTPAYRSRQRRISTLYSSRKFNIIFRFFGVITKSVSQMWLTRLVALLFLIYVFRTFIGISK